MAYRLLTSISYFVAICSLTGAKHYPEFINLNNNCDGKIVVDGDVVIKIYSYFQRPACKVTIVPEYGSNLLASFRSYSIDRVRSFVGLLSDCPESVQLTSSNNKLLDDGGYCKNVKPAGHYDLGNIGTFEYNTNNWTLYSSLRAELLVTEVFQKSSLSEACSYDQLDCQRSNVCVDNSLKCNGYDDCGNGHDEADECELSTKSIVGIVIGVAGAITIVVILVVVAVKKIRNKCC